jgi:hypothetical protein
MVTYDQYDQTDRWDGAGGVELVYLEHGSAKVLSTRAIQSASGLGTDQVFTLIIQNYLKKVLDD